ncbi:MAG: fumarylacetoacetate hydrolase family protein [Geminicoccaceae bacterium]|jgi:2-keto-4-pentenoate hydratase|nr:fumarylacetoacetate hydrolase family protein [Geminicoccaceae bacterium]HRY26664.1 fumarylacetoacetate hydrolase family protein [Geminicoccaceae bacterium]
MTHAEKVAANRLEGGRLDGLAIGEDEGYAVQQAANAALAKRLGEVAGHKIGATAEGMRKLLNVPGPIAGDVFASTVHQKRATLRLADFVHPGIETEIAVRIARDLTPAEAPWTKERIAAAVAAVLPAIEIVDNRYVDFKEAGAGTIIADNAFNAGSILGRETTDWQHLPLDRLTARTLIDGKEVGTGLSDELLGHPLNALVWLADRYAGLGWTLKAGRFVSLGTITPVQWITGPCEVQIEVEGLGGVEVVFG